MKAKIKYTLTVIIKGDRFFPEERQTPVECENLAHLKRHSNWQHTKSLTVVTPPSKLTAALLKQGAVTVFESPSVLVVAERVA